MPVISGTETGGKFIFKGKEIDKSKSLIAEDRLTIGDISRQNGYRTACIGKWHLGWEWPIKKKEMNPFRSGKKKMVTKQEHINVWSEVFFQSISGGPTDAGFDEYFGVDVPNYPPYCFIKDDKTVGIPAEFTSTKFSAGTRQAFRGPALYDWNLEDVLPALRDSSVAFIDRKAKLSNPFLLYLALM